MSKIPEPPHFSTSTNSNSVPICDNADDHVRFCAKYLKMTNVEIAKESGTSVITIQRYKKSGRAKIEPAQKLYNFIKNRCQIEHSDPSFKSSLLGLESKLEEVLTELRTLINAQS